MNASSETTDLLRRWRGGDADALDELMPLVYSELRRIAQSYLRQERIGHTLQATALVNEAYLRLIDQRIVTADEKAHFLAIAATTMRRVLVDHARKRRAAKRGWDGKVTLNEELDGGGKDRTEDLMALHEALEKLAAVDERMTRLVELKYFAGLSIEETAGVLGVSPATVKRDWEFARTWLRNAMRASQ